MECPFCKNGKKYELIPHILKKHNDKRYSILYLINKGLKYEKIIGNCKNPSIKGFIYEIIVNSLILGKQLIPDYEAISDSKLSTNNMCFTQIKTIRELFDKPFYNGNNLSDISVKRKGIGWIPFSIKYKDTKGDSDLLPLNACMYEYSKKTGEPYSLGYIVKDISKLTKHHDRNGRPEAVVIQKAKDAGHLFDEKDVKNAFNKFQEKLLTENFSNIEDIIDWMDKEFVNTFGRQYLQLKLNQKLALEQFKRYKNKSLIHCLNHKPRSGKTIIMLLYARYLLENGYNRILIMTSVPGTIDSFIEELNKYYEFKHINYKIQKEFMDVDEEFSGIVFCSVQYLKTGNKKDVKENQLLKQKTEKLKLFDCNIFDECHFHSSNKNTYDKIINVHDDKQIMKIFASGTSDKTEWFYQIDKRYIYTWSIEDEAFMKKHFPKTD
jgi:hypothetical protein